MKKKADRLVDIRRHDGIDQTATQNGALHVPLVINGKPDLML